MPDLRRDHRLQLGTGENGSTWRDRTKGGGNPALAMSGEGFTLGVGEGRAMSHERGVPEREGVSVELLGTLDLGPEIEGMAGRQLRMRKVTLAPGAVFGPVHDHVDRPGLVCILQGTITDHRNGVATEYGPGLGWPEDRNTVHWLENRGAIPAVEISVDIIRPA